MPTIEHSDLIKHVRYDPDTGRFTSRISGKQVGSLRDRGYRQLKILGQLIREHRAAWLYYYGKWPSGQIDHVNGDRSDNRIANLRDCDSKTNAENRRMAHKNNKTGLIGVQPHGIRFIAKIKSDGKQYNLGVFDTATEAHEAYLSAKRKMHKGCTI